MADPQLVPVDHDPWSVADRDPFVSPQQPDIALAPRSPSGTVGPNAASEIGRTVGGALIAPLWNAGQYLGGLINGNEEWQPSKAVQLGGDLALSLMPGERGAVALGNLARRGEQAVSSAVPRVAADTGSQIEHVAASLEQQPYLFPEEIAAKHLVMANGDAPAAERTYLRSVAGGRVDPAVIDSIYEGYKGSGPVPKSYLPDVDYASTKGEHTSDEGGLSPENAAFLKAYTGLDQTNFSGRVSQAGGAKSLSGFYLGKDPKTGEVVPSSIAREIYPDENAADHSMLELSPALQGQGIAKDLLANHVDWYRQNDIREVGVHAGLDGGGHTWARFGFVPTQDAWDGLRRLIKRDAQVDPRRPWPEGVQERILGALNSADPKSLWKIADDKTPVTFQGNSTTLGKALLRGRTWTGKLDLTDPEAMKRFDAYVANRPGKITSQGTPASAAEPSGSRAEASLAQ